MGFSETEEAVNYYKPRRAEKKELACSTEGSRLFQPQEPS